MSNYESKFIRDLGNSPSLSHAFLVYYERLKNDGYESLYNHIKSELQVKKQSLGEMAKTSSHLHLLAKREEDKERKVLKKVFGKEVAVDWDDKASIKEFINTINNCVGLQSIYERNLELIKSRKKSKSVISYFPSYFTSAFDDARERLLTKIKSKWNTSRSNEDMFVEVLEEELPNITLEAIKKMFMARPELYQEEEEIVNAYRQLLDAIGDVQSEGSFAQQISRIYELDTFSKDLAKKIKDKGNFTLSKIEKEFSKDMSKKSTTNFSKLISKETGQRGGLTLEAVERLVISVASKQLSKIDGAVIGTGASGGKNDNVYVYGYDYEFLKDTYDNTTRTSRADDIEKMEKYWEKIKQFNDNYIIYTNDKNYNLDTNYFKGRGFSSGSALSARSFYEVIKNVDKNARSFVATIINTANGAIGGNLDIVDEINQNIAQDVAMMLFSDYKTIGNKVSGNGGPTVIHLLNLNGIFIPLSFFIKLVAKAIDEISRTPETLVHASYKTPPILYPTVESQQASKMTPDEKPYKAWQRQRDYSLDTTKISIYFMKGFRDIIDSYL